jgi:UDP-N-acetylmuramoyl-L-alanyl-D-glutamate--2,6-diaminopimelate ligase
MRLAQLLGALPEIISSTGDLNTDISHISSDSRQVTPGALFVAYRGVGIDGHRYIADAIHRGAAAVVCEETPAELNVPWARVTDGRVALAWLHSAWYGHPSQSMTVIGVTGTDGKTTTCNLIYSILKAAGIRAGMISTVNAVIGDQTHDTGLHTTTPDSADVQRLLAQMRDAGTEAAVLETTSHGLAQHRVTGTVFDVAVVTNITHEHLDFHGSYEAYRDAKAMLFRSLMETQNPGARLPHHSDTLKTAVLNFDDSSFPFLAAIPAERRIAYSVRQGGSEAAEWEALRTAGPATVLQATNIRQQPSGMSFDVQACEHNALLEPFHLTTRLVGHFNVSNILAAVGAALAIRVPPSATVDGIAALTGVTGRMERIDRGQPFTAIVDFAHTPNALGSALTTARDLVAGGKRVLVVFGCAGLRDREKRRLMGDVAAQAADLTVITAEDPRTEDLAAIMAETAGAMAAHGRREGRDFVRIADRQAAILHAVRQAAPGDIVLVCGKGHEQSMCFGADEYPWRDQDALTWALDQALGRPAAPPPYRLPTWQT